MKIALKACISVTNEQTWQGRTSCLRRAQLMQSFEIVAFPQKHNGFPVVGEPLHQF